jgi:hypothetical protein
MRSLCSAGQEVRVGAEASWALRQAVPAQLALPDQRQNLGWDRVGEVEEAKEQFRCSE